MASASLDSNTPVHALINYEDPYVQPLIISALEKRLPASSYKLVKSLQDLPSTSTPCLQFVQYESIDWDHLMSNSSTSLANAYIIRKALIRKHYLSTTIANWITKHPDSALKRGAKPSVEFEVDYAEFLDDALVEAWELKESWARNEEKEKVEEREWWILKPGMSDRGQGIRLFSSEEELTAIFEEWDPETDDDEEDEEEEEEDARSDAGQTADKDEGNGNGIITSQLRHFVAQPYIHPPLLLAPPGEPSQLRKFHIRTYVLAAGALQAFIYKPMLALFAARPYSPPWTSSFDSAEDREDAMRAHLTNTCLQDTGDREGSVGTFWSLPDAISSQPDAQITAPHDWKDQVFAQIKDITAQTFEAAARGMSIHFQPLPNAFEIFGLDFMVGIESDGSLNTYLLEVNAFPDFRQTGDELSGLIGGLFEGVVEEAVKPFFGVGKEQSGDASAMVKVLDIDLGRR